MLSMDKRREVIRKELTKIVKKLGGKLLIEKDDNQKKLVFPEWKKAIHKAFIDICPCQNKESGCFLNIPDEKFIKSVGDTFYGFENFLHTMNKAMETAKKNLEIVVNI